MTMRTARLLRKSGLLPGTKCTESLTQTAFDPGQCYPERCPQPGEAPRTHGEPLGEPLAIHDAAAVIGCSASTVRQRYLPAGLPHHRLTPNGKLIFYRNQIIRWLLREQQKGGIVP
jgi:hypothetical protein